MVSVVACTGSLPLASPQPTWAGETNPVPYYPESYAQSDTGSEHLHELVPPCMSWGHMGTCEQEGHAIVHALICNREWCVDSGCGGINGAAHQRRKAHWYPKARQLHSIGRFVIPLPPETRDRYGTKAALGKLGTSFKRMMQRHGFDRGLRRWHFFGEDHNDSASGGEAPVFHPHLEVLVEAGYLTSGMLDSIKASVGRILGVGIDRVDVHYQYAKPKDDGKKCHFISYALRPTFTRWEWDEELAQEFIGFRNALSWGKWDGEPAWEIPVDSGREVPSGPLMAIQSGYCPHDGSRIVWGPGVLRLSMIRNPRDWIFIDGGYWVKDSQESRPEDPPGASLARV